LLSVTLMFKCSDCGCGASSWFPLSDGDGGWSDMLAWASEVDVVVTGREEAEAGATKYFARAD
jgi:hypothetical protein